MKTAKQLLRNYEKNQKALETVEVEYEKYKTKKRTKARIIKVKLEKRIDVLKTKLEEIDKKTENKMNRNREKKDYALTKLNGQIANFEKIVEMLKLKVDDLTINDADVFKDEHFPDKHFQWINDYLLNDKFLKIRLMICETYKRPVCKYAVIAVGKTPFRKYMNSSNMRIKSYGYHFRYADNMQNNISFLFAVRHFSSIERAEKWAKRKMKNYTQGRIGKYQPELIGLVHGMKNFKVGQIVRMKKNDILLNIIYEYNKVRAKYLTIIRNYRKKDNLMEIIEAKEMAEKL